MIINQHSYLFSFFMFDDDLIFVYLHSLDDIFFATIFKLNQYFI